MVKKENIEDIIALTPMQEGMLFHYLRDPESDLYFEQLLLEISGEIDIQTFERAWHFVIETHEMLRTVFRWENVKNPVQIVLKEQPFKPRYYDFSKEVDTDEKTAGIKAQDRLEKFDLHRVPFRVTLCKVEKDKYVMMVGSHHILYDGWSSGIILEAFFRAYDDLCRHREPVRPVKSKFKTFVRYIRDRGQETGAFWKGYLKGFSPGRTGTGVKRAKEKDAGNYTFAFTGQEGKKIKTFVRENRITLASFLYAAWGILLQAYHNSRDVIFDTTVSGRNVKIEGIEEMVGLFINTLPVRIKTNREETVMDCIRETYEHLQKRERYEHTSLALINEYLEKVKAENLFDTLVVIENYPLQTRLLERKGKLKVDAYNIVEQTRHDVTVIILPFDTIEVSVTYNGTLFDPGTIQELCRHFKFVVDGMAAHPESKVDEIKIGAGDERERVLAGLLRRQSPEVAEAGEEYAAPRDLLEEQMVATWSGVLGVEKETIGIDTDFFAYGGHSLKATLLLARLHKELDVKVPLAEIFRNPTIRGLSRYIREAGTKKQEHYQSIPPAAAGEYYELSSAQKRLYMIQQMEETSTAYNGPVVMLLEGNLDRDRLERSFRQLIRRHESLRTSFHLHPSRGEPVQRVHKDVEFSMEHGAWSMDDFSSLIAQFIRPFDLSRAPLLRVSLIKIEDNKHLLLFDMHHIISDGGSRDILVKELAALYPGRQLSGPAVQYKDFCHWQARRIASGELKEQACYWSSQFPGELPVLDMPCDYSRSPGKNDAGARLKFQPAEQQVQGLNTLMKETAGTLFMTLMTVFNVLLNKYSGQEDIVVGTAIGGRHHTDLENVIGLFMETLALRNFPKPGKTFAGFLHEVRENTLAAFENREYPFRELLKQLPIEKNFNRNPLFDVMLIVQNQERVPLEMEGLRTVPVEFDPGVSKVDLAVEVFESAAGMVFELEYSTSLFKKATVERFFGHFTRIIDQAAANRDILLSEIDLLLPEERQRLLVEFNNTDVGFPRDKAVHRLFEEQAAKTEHSIALLGGDLTHRTYRTYMTYKKLNEKSNQLAAVLTAKGVKPGVIAGIMVEPSVDMIIGLLAILKTGAAYLPIDPDYPEERVSYMLKDSGAGILVSGVSDLIGNIGPIGPIGPIINELPTQLAYVIYTSGSTGRPRGVMVDHGSLVGYLFAFAREFGMTSKDIVIQQASFSFDTFGEEVYPALLQGGQVVIPRRSEVLDVVLLRNFIAGHCVTVLDCSPMLLNELNTHASGQNTGWLAGLRLIISGGDVLKREYIDNLLTLTEGQIYNTYGPTEATVCAAYHRCSSADPSNVPIGRPIANYKLYILDTGGKLLPTGVPGELCIGGIGVSRGYLNQPELTAEKFLWSDWSDRSYKTGDLARWLPGGSIEFLGRIDHQVKIRGFRIELGEIENRLLAHECVKEVVVLAREDAGRGKYLAAYIILSGTGATEHISINQALRQYLSRQLPGYMVPAYFIEMESFPMTPGGKIDRKALPGPEGSAFLSTREYAAPGTELEKKMVSIWQEILGLKDITIGIEDDFFELGGDSILANRTIARMRDQLEMDVSLRKFFENPFIKALAAEVTASGKEGEVIRIPRVPGNGRPIPLSFSQERLWFIQQLDSDSTAYHVPRALRIRGKLDISLFERTFTEIIRRHEILRTVFPTVDGVPVQCIKEPFEFHIPVIDLSAYPVEEQPRKVSDFIIEEGRRPFDFERGPMLRVTALKLKEEEHIVISSEHHLVHDGWTQGVMLREFLTIYTAFSRGNTSPLPELPIQYADYVVWQKDYMSGERLKRYLDFWRQKLAGLPPLLELPTDYPRPSVMRGRGAMKRLMVPAELTARLDRFSKTHGVTLFMTMLAVFKILLHRYAGIEDICIGTGIANRRYKEMEGMLGMVINTLPLRTKISGDLSFLEGLQQVKTTCLQAYDYEETPFEKIVELLQPERSLSYMPLIQVLFSFMDTPTEHLRLPGLEFIIEGSHNRSSKFDFNLVVITPREGEELAGEILIEWEYNTDLFKETTIARMMRHYYNLLEEILRDPGQKISALRMLENSEIQTLLYHWNDTSVDYDRERTVVHALAAHEAGAPDRIALMYEDEQITCGELAEKTGRMAQLLVDRGVGPGTIAGILMERSIEMVVGIIAVLKAGGAYLPIDTTFPEERIKYLLSDSNAKVLLSEGSDLVKKIIGPIGPILKDLPTHPTHLSYVIYTSGSTGKPKGVMVDHGALNNFIYSMYRDYNRDFGPSDICLSVLNITFDVSVCEMFLPLFFGSKLVVLPKKKIFDVMELSGAILERSVTFTYIYPGLLEEVSEYLRNSGSIMALNKLMVGVEPIKDHVLEAYWRLNNQMCIINAYGPTEATIWATSYRYRSHTPVGDIVPIGKPLGNTGVLLLDRGNQLVPPGAKGELCICGHGLARGYLNRPELTAEKFIFRSHRPLYRTGDLARWLSDGNLKFCGRVDHQVKIRGNRVEPGEVENRLLKCERVKEAVVMARQSSGSDKYLCAYWVPAAHGKAGDEESVLREYLLRHLPDYMVPSFFIKLDKLPLNTNGKLDRKALPVPDIMETAEEYAAPSGEIEEELVKIWSRVLEIPPERIGVNTGFFKLGGHSLKATVLMARIHRELDVKIPLAEVFKTPSIRGISSLIKSIRWAKGRKGNDFEPEREVMML